MASYVESCLAVLWDLYEGERLAAARQRLKQRWPANERVAVVPSRDTRDGMRSRLTIVVIFVVAVAGVIVWRCRGGGAPGEHHTSDGRSTIAPPPRPLPFKRGSIAGTISDDANRPIPGARVCARGWSTKLGTEPFREPTCTTADTRGGYTIDGLLPARYAVTAFAPRYLPAVEARDGGIELAEGARVTDISLVLRGGGVELTGMVADVTAGPIARARVTAATSSSGFDSPAVTTLADDQGRFSLWVAPGAQYLTATADGYANGGTSAQAPGTAEIRLTPEATLEGEVVDAATGAPIEGARVGVTTVDFRDDPDRIVVSDARGAFRFDRLRFDRFTITARTEHGYGRSAGSLRVGLGEHVGGVVIRMYPARRVAGTVVISPGGAPCRESFGSLREEVTGRWLALERDGHLLVADGVLPGTYTPRISCRGFADRDAYDPITVGEHDVAGLVWEVTRGATLRGKVVTRSGVPISGASVFNQRTGRTTDKWTRSRDDGSYELVGLAPGVHKVSVFTNKAIVARGEVFVLDVDAPTTHEHDFVLDDAGTIKGTTVDPDGRPEPYVDVVVATVDPDNYRTKYAQSDAAGVFEVGGLPAGDYRVELLANNNIVWPAGGAQDGSASLGKPTATVRVNQVTTVKLVTAAARRETITGRVVDAAGKPVGDALIQAVADSRVVGSATLAANWSPDNRPVLTQADGTFTLTRLAAGSYTVRAYRNGGGEAVVEHVQTGSSVTLRIGATGSIAGTASERGGASDKLVVTVEDNEAGITRTERFFGTQGTYKVEDLPKGRYTVQWDTERGRQRREVTLGEGETKNVDVELEPLVTVTGRVVDLRARTPLAAIRVTAYATQPPDSYIGTANTDASGRFRIARVPLGPLELRLAGDEAYPKATAARSVERTAGANDSIDLGEVPMVAARATGDAPVGELGFTLDESLETRRKRELVVEDIDPRGPAARCGLREGDRIVGVDGIDLRGPGYDHWEAAVTAPPGTKLVLELARGAKVTLVLARPAE
jgi:protocatechuate 3,4-dioxygenase beta subunit